MVERPHVLQLVDTLAAGGAERVACDIALALPRERWRSSLIATRAGGPLQARLAGSADSRVDNRVLGRRGRFDVAAVRRLRAHILNERVTIVHAHASSLFIAIVAAWRTPAQVVWHDHFGRLESEIRPAWIYRPFARRAAAVIAVDPSLARWSIDVLGLPPEKVSYVPNFVLAESVTRAADLPGAAGARVVCLANFREQKDHETLLLAWALVAKHRADARLFLIGAGAQDRVRALITEHEVTTSVVVLGERDDAAAVLAGCDIGVLSSRSEGLPLALLEYGFAGLAAATTRVGRCAEVLDFGSAGLLSEPGDAAALAGNVIALLDDGSRRGRLATALSARVRERHGPTNGIARIETVYRALLVDQ